MLNERIEAEEYLKGKRFNKNHVYRPLYILCKYYLNKNFSKDEIFQLLDQWRINYNTSRKDNLKYLINKACNDKVEFKDNVKIFISNKEIEDILSRFDRRNARLCAFAILCYYKSNSNNFGLFKIPQSAFCKWIKIADKTFSKYIEELIDFKYIELINHSNIYHIQKSIVTNNKTYKLLVNTDNKDDYIIYDEDFIAEFDYIFSKYDKKVQLWANKDNKPSREELRRLNFKLIDKYNGYNEKSIYEDKDGYRYYITFSQIKRGIIPQTFSRLNPFILYNINLWTKKYSKPYTILSNIYINKDTKLEWQCNKCGNIFNITWHNMYTKGKICSCYKEKFYNESQYEIYIRQYLEKRNFIYMQEYSFNNLKGLHGKELRFDFAIFNNNQKLLFLIEYDGEYHYLPIKSEDHLYYMQMHDKLKNDYCERNNLKLIRISYLQKENIKEILDKETGYI